MTIQQNNESDKPEEEGGAAWEVRTAAELLAEATGNPAVGTAMHRAIEGTVNATIAAMAPSFSSTFSKVLETTLRAELSGVHQQMTVQSVQLAEAISAISTVDRRVDLSNSRAIDRTAEFQRHIDARFDNFGIELDGVGDQIGGVKGAIDTLHAGFLEIGEKVDSVASRQDEQAALLAQVVSTQTDTRADIDTLKDNDGHKFEWLQRLDGGVEKLRKELKAQATRIDAAQRLQADTAAELRELKAIVSRLQAEQQADG